jgi:hypothetical protein
VTVPALESVFLNRSPRPETRDLRRVLVLGGDGAGRDLASRLVGENFEVVLLGDESNPQFSAESSLATGTRL